MKKTRSPLLVKAATVLVLLAAVPQMPLYANPVPACGSGTVGDILGETCSIGNLEFSFDRFDGGLYTATYQDKNPVFTRFSSAQITFIPTSNGFTLGISGPQSVTTSEFSNAPVGHAAVYASLTYSVVALNGTSIGGHSVSSSGILSVSGPTSSQGWSGRARFYGQTNDPNSPFFAEVGGYRIVTASYSHNTDTGNVSYYSSVPFVSGIGVAVPFDLDVYRGGTGTWATPTGADPSTTFSFFSSPPAGATKIPEPSSLILLATGVLGLAISIKRVKPSKQIQPVAQCGT